VTARPTIGVDLGGTRLRAGIVADAEVVQHAAEPTDPAGGEAVLDQVARLVRSLVDAHPRGEVAGVGVGVPAAVDLRTGVVDLAQNLPDWPGLAVRDELARRLGLPVVVDNDAAAAVLGERAAGAARGVEDVVLLSLGTGVGAGIVSGGRLVRGHRGAAGEVADLPLGADPTDPTRQRAGVYESVVGTAGLRARAATIGMDDVPALFAAVDRGETDAERILQGFARDVALGVVALQAVLDPELVVLAGGIGARPLVAEAVGRVLPELGARPPHVVTTALGDHAGVIGAAALLHA
jgi:glucokinase